MESNKLGIGKINDKTNYRNCIKVDIIEYYQPKDIPFWEVLCRYRTKYHRKNTTILQINFRICRQNNKK